MIPTALLFSRYRAFREFTRLDLAPLTVIIGKNGGGKSVLTRLPLLLASGLDSEAEAPLNLGAGGVSHAARFEDLIYQRSAQPFCLGAEISDDERTLRFVTTLRYVVERHALGIEAFELFDGGQAIVRLRAARPEDIGYPAGMFLAQFGPSLGEEQVRVEIAGLFPLEIAGNPHESAELRSRRELFERVFASPSYLGPFRSEEGSLPRIPRQGVRHLGARGQGALDMLGDNELRGDGSLVRNVEDWFEAAMGGNRVKLEMAGDLPRLRVHDPMRNIDVDICDTGAGFAQVFPVVVQNYAQRIGLFGSPMMIIEQPELHLHPAAHGNVADLISETVASCGEVRCICETHSEQMITRLRRRVAEGKFPASMIKIASVGHQSAIDDPAEALRMIEFDNFGNLDAWPIGVFDEAFDDLVLLRAAAQRRLAEEPSPKS